MLIRAPTLLRKSKNKMHFHRKIGNNIRISLAHQIWFPFSNIRYFEDFDDAVQALNISLHQFRYET